MKPTIAMLMFAVLLSSCARSNTATPTPTPPPASPAELLVHADQQRELGQFDVAAGDYQQLLTQYPHAPEARVARYGLAHSAYLRQDWAAARSLLEQFVAQGGDDIWQQRALFLLARVAETLGDHAAAIDAYSRYEATPRPLVGYAALRRGAQLNALNRTQEAALAYETGAAQPIAPEQRVSGLQTAIAIRDAAGQSDLALADVSAMLDFVRSPSFRPTVLLDGATRARALGRDDLARQWLRELVERWGQSAEAPLALDQLAELGEGVAPLQAALIAYNHARYVDAVSLFDAALAGDLSADDRAMSQRLRALAIREQGDFGSAEAALNALADGQPDTPIGRQARLDAIQTHGQAGDRQGALEAYRAFAANYPDDPLAPEALRRVVEIVSWDGDAAATANAQLELGSAYPWSNAGQTALHDAASYALQTGQYEQALAAWRRLGDANLGPPRAEGYYWAGRTAANIGDQEQATTLLRSAYDADPNGYYAARAADLLGISEGDHLPIGAPIDAEDEAAGSQWIASWSTAAPTATLDIAAYKTRALELHETDLLSEALSEWTAARDAAGDNPHTLYAVALAAARADVPYAAVTTARALMALAPVEAGEPPTAIRQLLYPTPYATAVIGEARNVDLDPRVLYALMRQESIFNPDATSWVGARGLAQVMPTTGEGIAQSLGVAPFHPDDLYRPVVSIRFGAFYISAQIQRMNGSIHGGLAAYNGGPGNAERWADGTTVADPDRFIEAIDYPETSHYVQVVYANYGAYRRLYAP